MRLPSLVAALSMSFAAHAQTPPPETSAFNAAAAAPAAAPLPDIEFSADVHMDSIAFGSDPKAEVRFTGGPGVDTRHDVERGGLPRPVAAGRTYRNVTVRTTISATLLDPAIEAAATGQASPAASPPTTEDSP